VELVAQSRIFEAIHPTPHHAWNAMGAVEIDWAGAASRFLPLLNCDSFCPSWPQV